MYEICLSLLLHLFVSDDVDIHCGEQEQTLYELLRIAVHAQQSHAVCEYREEQHAEQCAYYVALAAGDRQTADDDRRDAVHICAGALIRLRDIALSYIQHRCKTCAGAGYHKGYRACFFDVYAGQVCSL